MGGREPWKVKKDLKESYAFRNFLIEEVKRRDVPTEIFQREEPWHHLYMNRTLCNYFKTVYFCDKRIPNDRLDFNLLGKYDHFRDFNVSTSDVAKRDRDHLCDHRLYQKPEPYEIVSKRPYECHVLHISTHPKRNVIQSAELAIERSHLVQSNPGYARKPRAGGFYTA